ncbi:DNA repair protein RadA [Pseudoclavibacter sp. 13-3]|uniref:DNA repair protein RadA n=1 Tax=Pseudoclavibacter sp. 13-3 TaxID=2901228 RepID=UPI001E528EDA|nr:DNA repair protein RadA [Pseudoclavibacter sp. 13-3]MCD7101495.1 DNA repair protein RadA [Pseudoclavibacter sp. 13-3]
MAKNTFAPYHCTECGFKASKWVGRCPECQAWGTVVEVGTQTGISSGRRGSVQMVDALGALPTLDADRLAKPITELSSHDATHVPTGIGELDRVLGGGIVPGAAILLSGEPGVGKSTLLLEVAARWASEGRTVLYLTAEESAGQVRLRAERTGAVHERLLLAAETDLTAALAQVEAAQPSLVIVDSVQTITDANIEGIPGGTAQVRAVAHTLTRAAKQWGIPLLLVGHVTKDGSIAGPRLLEHLVDVVCQFEGDPQTSLRFLRAHKNRFGSIDEVGCFEMGSEGIREVPDPSGLFLTRGGSVPGTIVTIAMEGRRALPVEIQALVVASTAPQPRRVTNGLDSSRVSMLIAVLERRAGITVSNMEVYVSTVGGVKVTDPAADLPIALAIASAATGRPIDEHTVAYGEISLAGQVRRTAQSAQRADEAVRLGYTTHLDDRSVSSLHEALARALQHRRI